MAGCTDLAYRMVSRKRGMEFCFLEMVSANGLMHESQRTFDLMKTIPEDRPLGAQLMGCDPDIMAAAAEKIENAGYDLLDLNLGCPVRKVTAGGAGAAMLKDPANTEKVFKKVVAALKKIPVTIKVRKGYEDDSGKEAVEIAKIAEGSGIAAVTVHGRTRAQGYTGKADWEAIGKVKRAVKIPVIGNGDVLTADDAKRLRDISGCDGVMIGRGGLGNPWVYRNVEAGLADASARPYVPTLEERRQTLLKHLDYQVRFEGERLAVLKMRRIGCWYFNGLPGAAQFRNAICRAESTDAVRELILGFPERFCMMPSATSGNYVDDNAPLLG